MNTFTMANKTKAKTLEDAVFIPPRNKMAEALSR